MTLLATYTIFMKEWKPDLATQRSVLVRETDEVCDHVHHAKDQCAFVRANCGEDEPGLISYLTFYYCTLGMVKPVAFVILTLWLGLLFSTIGIAASDFFSVNLSTIASVLGLPESLAGVTFLAFGNGSPDVFSTFAAMNSNSGSMAIGELIGAAGFITAVVAGSMALVREFKVSRKSFVRDIVFFIVSVSFTMVFLTDGKIYLWECGFMIGFYVFYVCFVVGWHWFSSTRQKRRNKEAASRSHFTGPSSHAIDEVEPFHDDAGEEDDGRVGRSRGSGELPDISALEAGPRDEVDGSSQDDEEEEQRRHIASEMTSSMRVNRPRGRRSYTSTITPIRPSLVGALEFRSVLSSLQRSRNMRMAPLSRGYSDYNPQPGPLVRSNTVSNEFEPYTDDPSTSQLLSRGRALSSGDAPRNLHNDTMQQPSAPEADSSRNESRQRLGATEQGSSIRPVSVESSNTSNTGRPRSVAQRVIGDGGRERTSSTISVTRDGHLAPPDIHQRMSALAPEIVVEEEDPKQAKSSIPVLSLQIPSPSPRPNHASSPSLSPFPGYYESPMSDGQRSPGLWRPQSHATLLPPLAETPDHIPGLDPPDPSKPVKWWPYNVLPPPQVLWRTMFPTLQGWREKSIWDKAFSLFSLPTVFLLVITLPVVEAEVDSEDDEADDVMQPVPTLGNLGTITPAIAIEHHASIEPETEWQEYRRRARSVRSRSSSASPLPRSAGASPFTENQQGFPDLLPPSSYPQVGQPLSVSGVDSEHTIDDELSWNRWLLALQTFTGPLFTVFIVWAKYMDQPVRVLVEMISYSLLASSITLVILLVSTSPTTKPRYHFLFCFLGFIIAIAWISTIAEEVVGVLKAVGVILGMSEAILGLTIFAVGNSVGDLVADITVARLGYPVMALSACFGGPMLNILLGIGMGGTYMSIKGANHYHKKHPDKPLHYKSYHIDVTGTLLISAITVLVTLITLLILVPANKWIMTRKIGLTLITLWSVSTVINVVVEVTGVWKAAA
ncbi:hypothetical protein VP1G_09395 [Cytospora mali]|uniref:Sodium/calcium exchanger membrane region domain-containing protein n=1 Tax=Cytospora mali TaxID=578113 RepID=A0A194VEF3_CYTMA|nr:hypothetical protein VP1G_09395 [Valsa mali var. pyri (nom. inval.)]